MAEAKVGGYSKTRTIEGVEKVNSVSTLRFSTPGSLDTEISADGTSSVLVYLKQIAQQIIDISPNNPLPAGWTEIVKVPKTGTVVTVSLGVRSEFTEDA